MKVNARDLKWLENETRRLIRGCRRLSRDGIPVYMPDCSGNYGALWTRDFAYYVENVPDMIPQEEIREALLYLIRGQRDDGCAPDRVDLEGRPVYCAGPLGRPIAAPPLDNAQFLTKIACTYARHMKDLDLFGEIVDRLDRAMDWVPLSRDGLVWNDPENPHSPYGFTDCIGKTGELLFCSILYWEASRMLADMAAMIDEGDIAEKYGFRSWMIENNLVKLWDEEVGAFMAAGGDCRQVDIWGNIYLISVDLPLDEDIRRKVGEFLVRNYEAYTHKGMVRHLLEGEHWEKLLVDVPQGEYQNGGYWSTATGWLIVALSRFNLDLAEKTFREFISFSRENGFWECVGPEGYRKLRDYVPSAANPVGGIRHVLDEGFVTLYS